MKRIAVFGNAAGGKSTLSRRLAEITGLPLYTIDIVQFRGGRYSPDGKDGGKLPDGEYLKLHDDIVSSDRWIIDGFGGLQSAWQRFSAADTLVHVDLPLLVHYWGVTTRLAAGLFAYPPGWPPNSPVWESSLDSYRIVRLCHRNLTPKYRQYVAEAAAAKRVHHLTSRGAMELFLQEAQREQS